VVVGRRGVPSSSSGRLQSRWHRVEAPSGRGSVVGGPTRARSRGRDELGGLRATSGRGYGRPSQIGVVG
jgi:hypothetical protein